MARENAATKARRLLAEGRVVIRAVHGCRVDASVRGDTGRHYEVVHSEFGWHCPCEARGTCSHTQAVQLVTAPEDAWRSP